MPRPNKTKSRIRSGRFKFGSGIAGELIILEKSADAFYRFFNGGQQTFNVRTTLDGANTDYPVEANCSVDLQVPQDGKVKIQKLNAADDVEGVYEAPGVRNDVASGRFKFPKRAVTTTLIVVGGNVQIFRILNSGVNSINVGANGAAARELKQHCSFDVFVKGSDVTVSNEVDEAIQGVYDLLNENGEADTRSGRFKSDADLPIIDFKVSGPSLAVIYRIYNSGENKFRVLRGTFDLGVVQPNTSMEIEIPGNGQHRTIMINRVDDLSFEGVYEFLGVAN